MRLEVGSGTDVGQLRSLNEDSLLVANGLFAVADGMGGHRGGEVDGEVGIGLRRTREVLRGGQLGQVSRGACGRIAGPVDGGRVLDQYPRILRRTPLRCETCCGASTLGSAQGGQVGQPSGFAGGVGRTVDGIDAHGICRTNLVPQPGMIVPAFGVYACRAHGHAAAHARGPGA